MDTQCPKSILGGIDGGQWVVHPEIPQPDLTVAAARNKLPETTTLHVDIRDPLLMLAPDLDHGGGRFQPLIEYTHGAISEASNEYVACNLVRSQ